MTAFELLSGRLLLRPFQADDLPAFVAYRSDPEIARYQCNTPPQYLLERVQFRCERLVEADWFKGEWTTLRIYALLEREWRSSPELSGMPRGNSLIAGERAGSLDRVLIGGHEKRSIVIVDYVDGWPARYEHHRERVRSALGADALGIEHIGSTAVPGLAAKPIIDMLVTVPATRETSRPTATAGWAPASEASAKSPLGTPGEMAASPGRTAARLSVAVATPIAAFEPVRASKCADCLPEQPPARQIAASPDGSRAAYRRMGCV